MAKAKAAPKTDDGTIARDKPAIPATPKASQVERTESFTAAVKADAHAAADHFLGDEDDHFVGDKEEVSREESDAGPDGVKVTVTYK